VWTVECRVRRCPCTRVCGSLWTTTQVCSCPLLRRASPRCAVPRASTRSCWSRRWTSTTTSASRATRWKSATTWTPRATASLRQSDPTYGRPVIVFVYSIILSRTDSLLLTMWPTCWWSVTGQWADRTRTVREYRLCGRQIGRTFFFVGLVMAGLLFWLLTDCFSIYCLSLLYYNFFRKV